MPIYGREKTKVMVRSILPSTARKQAKSEKDHLHRENRRKSALQLATLRGPATYVIDEFEDAAESFTYWVEPHRTGWDDIVSDRRGSDKLNHFEVWAYQKTKHVRMEDRLSKIAGILPKNVIGEHALSHLRFLEPTPRYYWWQAEDYWRLPSRYQRQERLRRSKALRSAHTQAWMDFKAAVHSIKHDDVKRNKYNAYLKRNPQMVEVGKREGTLFDKPYLFPVYEDQTNLIHGYHDAVRFIKATTWARLPYAAAYFNIEVSSTRWR